MKSLSIVYCLLLSISINLAQDNSQIITLPDPVKEGGKPLLEALNERHSSRSFSNESITEHTLSNLLWAAFGVNRTVQKKRTAPSAWNMQEIDIYVAMEKGLYLFDAFSNSLKLINNEDVRELTGVQPFVKNAPVNLVYVVNESKLSGDSPETKTVFSAVSAGAIIQNVYLYCASERLVTVARGLIPKKDFADVANLKDSSLIIMAQSVGYPAK